MHIQFFDDINESHIATGYGGRTDLSAFHIFSIADMYPHTRRIMPPYRFNFYQIVLLENSDDAMLNMNTQTLAQLSNMLLFASPDHILSWVRGEAQQGFILYFKDEFLAHYPRLVKDEFPYFRMDELNTIHVDDGDKARLKDHFVRLHHIFNSPHPYRVAILSAWLIGLLFDCKHLHERQTSRLRQYTPQEALVFRFQQFINQHFASLKKVSDYARLLSVTPDYLGQVVRMTTGKTPLSFITERILLEAKKLLHCYRRKSGYRF